MNTIEHGPFIEQTMVMAGTDYYKPTMSQMAYEHYPDASVTFTFKNRGAQRIMDYVDPSALQERLDGLQQAGINEDERAFLGTQQNSQGEQVFSDEYLNHLGTTELPAVDVMVADDDIAIQTTGEWPMVTFWETVVMSEINELYFENYVREQGLDIMEVYDEAQERLQEKIAVLQANPDIKIADFGTRRHFSLRWQAHVVEELLAQCPQNVIGTSNVALANRFGVKPIGTFAHEMPMVYAGLADSAEGSIKESHNRMLDEWFETYGEDFSIALTDTFGSDFFFEDFTAEQAAQWRGLRHDSGDAVEFGEKAIAFYEANDVDPTTKTIVFSDGLDINEIVKLHDHFEGRVNMVFGWGTTLTNDMGIKPLNIVMKATEVNETKTVKLSDDEGKHTGPIGKVALYQEIFNGTPIAA